MARGKIYPNFFLVPLLRNIVKGERCSLSLHMGREHASRDKKLPMVIFLIFGQMNIYKRIPEDENPSMKGF